MVSSSNSKIFLDFFLHAKRNSSAGGLLDADGRDAIAGDCEGKVSRSRVLEVDLTKSNTLTP